MHSLENRVVVVRGDITRQDVEAVVNAANTTLLGGGGVDGAIHRAAGPDLLRECRTIGGCPTGQARITGGYGLPASFVIHTVGPVWSGGSAGEEKLLAACYSNSLRLGREHGVATIAFPAISCGAYRFPVSAAARIALETTLAFLQRDSSYTEVRFVCFDEAVFEAFSAARESALALYASRSDAPGSH